MTIPTPSPQLSAPDLTQRPPRSPRVRLAGYVLLARILDKGRALLAGKLGDYRFNGKGMDRHFYQFTGISAEALLAELATGKGDGEIILWVQEQAGKTVRGPWEVNAWSDFIEKRTPDGDVETLTDFAELVGKFSATREDVHTWFDFLDLDDHCTFGGKA
jgi:hypothetical protein